MARGDDTAALREWMDGARAGDASSMGAIGTMYDIGRGVQQDYALAHGWYLRAAQGGDVRAMFNVAAMYDSGRGVLADRAEAVRWYTLAARQGYGRAAYNLGVIYRDGDGVPRNAALAIQNFRIAEAAGIRAAGPNLVALGAAAAARRPAPAAGVAAPGIGAPGVMTPGPAAPADTDALRRFEQAALTRSDADPAALRAAAVSAPRLANEADRGDAADQYRAGYLYERGIGLRADPVKSYVYYLRAAGSRDPALRAAALRGAAEMGRKLSAEQHATAREILVAPKP